MRIIQKEYMCMYIIYTCTCVYIIYIYCVAHRAGVSSTQKVDLKMLNSRRGVLKKSTKKSARLDETCTEKVDYEELCRLRCRKKASQERGVAD